MAESEWQHVVKKKRRTWHNPPNQGDWHGWRPIHATFRPVGRIAGKDTHDESSPIKLALSTLRSLGHHVHRLGPASKPWQ